MTSASVTNLPAASGPKAVSKAASNGSLVQTDFHKLMEQSQGVNKSDYEKPATETSVATAYPREDKRCVITQASETDNLDQVQEAADSYTEDVKDMLCESLEISEEELNQAMETLGLSMMDLAQPGNLTQLIAYVTGTDSNVELLMNDSYVNILDQVNELTGELLDKTGLTVPKIQELMQNLSQVTEELPDSNLAVTQEVAGKQPLDEPQEVLQKEAGFREVSQDDATATESPQLTVTVEHTGEEMKQSSDEEAGMDRQNQPKEDGQIQNRENILTGGFDSKAAVSTFDSVVTEATTGQESSSYVTDARAVMEQIVQQAKVTFSLGETTMELELHPASLGKVLMEVSQKEGNVSAHLYTQNEAVKEALESQMVQLRENLNQQGVKADSVEVSVATHEFERNLDEQGKQEEQQKEEMERSAVRQRRSINLSDPASLQGLMTEEEELTARIMRDNGNTVNYSA